MAVNPRQKGAACEIVVRDLLIKHTGLAFERVPGSGAGAIKGDVHIPAKKDRFCIEIKHYADSHWNDKIFTSKTNNIVIWWTKLLLQSKQTNKEPLLIWKYNRSKFYVCTAIKPANTDNYVDIRWIGCYTLLLDEWLRKEDVKWLK
jgi:Holliday junction resolvase